MPALPHYRDTLARAGYTAANDDLLRLVGQAMALGFQDKWIEPVAGSDSCEA